MADDMTSRDVEAAAGGAPAQAIPQEELNRITDDLIAAFKTVFDPEIPVDIYELGLIYKVDIDDDRKVDIEMTLTAPGCGMGQVLTDDVTDKLTRLPGTGEVSVELTFDPPWGPERMSEEGRLELGMFY